MTTPNDSVSVLHFDGPEFVEALVGAVADNFPSVESPMVTNEWGVEIAMVLARQFGTFVPEFTNRTPQPTSPSVVSLPTVCPECDISAENGHRETCSILEAIEFPAEPVSEPQTVAQTPSGPATTRDRIYAYLRGFRDGDLDMDEATALLDAIEAEARAIAEARALAAEERAAHWKGNHDWQVDLKRKQHDLYETARARITELRVALEAKSQAYHAVYVGRAGSGHEGYAWPNCAAGSCTYDRALTSPSESTEVEKS